MCIRDRHKPVPHRQASAAFPRKVFRRHRLLQSRSRPIDVYKRQTPISEFAPILSTSKTVTIVCFVLLAIGGAILSYSLAVHNYRPLQHLAKKAAGNDTPSSPPMEYLERSIDELVKMRTITAEADRNHHTLYCDNLFNKLLYGEILSEDVYKRQRSFPATACMPQ